MQFQLFDSIFGNHLWSNIRALVFSPRSDSSSRTQGHKGFDGVPALYLFFLSKNRNLTLLTDHQEEMLLR